MGEEKTKKKGKLLYVAIVIVAVVSLGLFKTFGPATGTFTKGEYLYLRTGSDYPKLEAALKEGGFISDLLSFDILAKFARLPSHVHPGKYKLHEGMSNYDIIRMLRSGRQTPVKLVINKMRTRQEFVSLLAANLEADSVTLSQLLVGPAFLSQFGLDSNTVMCAILPDTYDFFWNIQADKALQKIAKNYTRFWNSERKQQARNQNISQVKAIIVASIVDEETNINDDKPKIASVYLNRLRKGMKLQADPTVRFALGDFTIKRVAGAMLENPSPYNTYLYEGLPPGPICTPSPNSIEAVLNAPQTTYLYFCAKEDFSGYTVFASTYDEQMKNAHAYQKALDARGIK